jgi:hypothetical protein
MTSVNRFLLILVRVCPTACIAVSTLQNHLPWKDSFFGNISKSQLTHVHGEGRMFPEFPSATMPNGLALVLPYGNMCCHAAQVVECP